MRRTKKEAEYMKIKKKAGRVLAILLLFSIPFFYQLNTVQAYGYSINYTCQEENCIEGQDITWYVTFQNLGVKFLRISSVRLLQMETNEELVATNYTYDPFNVDVGDLLIWLNVKAAAIRTYTLS